MRKAFKIMENGTIVLLPVTNVTAAKMDPKRFPAVVMAKVSGQPDGSSYRVASTMEGLIDTPYAPYDMVRTSVTAETFGGDIPQLVALAHAGGDALRYFMARKRIGFARAASKWSTFGYTRSAAGCNCPINPRTGLRCSTGHCGCKKHGTHYCDSKCHQGLPCANRDPKDDY